MCVHAPARVVNGLLFSKLLPSRPCASAFNSNPHWNVHICDYLGSCLLSSVHGVVSASIILILTQSRA